jgi:hypothetical protein
MGKIGAGNRNGKQENCKTEKSKKPRNRLKTTSLIIIEINRKLRVATKIGSTFFWFSTSYRAAEKV